MSDPAHPQRIDFSGFEAALRRRAAEQAQAARTPTEPTALASRSRLTEVELTWIEKKLEHWIRFGRVAQDRILTRRTRVVGFRPGAVFAFVRWASNDFGTIVSRIDVVRAVTPGEPYTTLPFVRPGGDILLRIEGWPKVQQVLAAIDAIGHAQRFLVDQRALDARPGAHIDAHLLAHEAAEQIGGCG